VSTRTDQELLGDYAERRSEAAFADLVQRHIDLVYSAALRRVGDPHLAKDVTQGTFAALAQHARQLSSHPVLSGWLHRTTQNIATNLIRTNTRRQAREQEVVAMNQLLSAPSDADWQDIAPHLDAALDELDNTDRDAVMLRYFEKKSAREMAAQLGISDDAAQKRVSRAVERLREFFAKRGVTVGASGLALVIAANAVQGAPVGLALTVSTAAVLTGTTVAATIATQTTMNWINLKSATAILAAALAAGSGTYLAKNHEARTLQQEVHALKSEKTALLADRENALAGVESNKAELAQLREKQNDLLRLRAEVAALRKQSTELTQLREEKRLLQTALRDAAQAGVKPTVDPENDPERQMAYAKMNDAKLLVLGLLMFANDNQEQLPADLSQTTNYWKSAEHQLTATNNFELVLGGPLKSVTAPATTIAVREKEATFMRGKWFKTYGFADGHSELKTEPPEGFAAWEKAHIVASPPEQH